MAGKRKDAEVEEAAASEMPQTEDGLDVIEYRDMGDWTLEIDRRGPTEQRRRLPKLTTGLGRTADEERELEQRLHDEVEAPAKLAELAEDPFNPPSSTAEVAPEEAEEDEEPEEEEDADEDE